MNFTPPPTFPKTLRLVGYLSSVLCCGATLRAATLTPVAATGYNQDIIVEKNAVASQAAPVYGASVTATLEYNTTKNGTTFFETGLDTAMPTTGLPSNNTSFTSADLPNVVFQLQPYTQSNSLLLTTGQTGTLTLAAPKAFSNIAFLVASGGGNNGGGTDALTIHFSDGTPAYTALNLSIPNWFNNNLSPAFTASGRVDVPSGGFVDTMTGSSDPRLFDTSYNLAAIGLAAHPISSIDFTYTGDGNAAVFAISGVVPEPSSRQLALAFGAMAIFVAVLRVRHKRVP